jgi:hypothetical protein
LVSRVSRRLRVDPVALAPGDRKDIRFWMGVGASGLGTGHWSILRGCTRAEKLWERDGLVQIVMRLRDCR